MADNKNKREGKYSRYNKVSEAELRKTVQDHQGKAGDTPDTTKQWRNAGHEFRNDYQKSGSPFGELSKRTPTPPSQPSPKQKPSDSEKK